MEVATNRLNEINYNTQGCKMWIDQYNSYKDIIVKFENGFTKHTSYQAFKKGEVINNFYPNVINGHGYLGNSKSKQNGKHKKSYLVWRSMLERCYDKNFHKKESSYINCSVYSEWLCYENFEKWYNENYYEIPNEKMCLDKDILIKNNKIYSPNTCIFVPQRINNLFTKTNKNRGNLPIGVSYYPNYNQYTATCSIIKDNKRKRHKTLGYFNTIEEAFNAYKNFKEKYIKQIANEYKDYIPIKLYNALLNYQVEITD